MLQCDDITKVATAIIRNSSDIRRFQAIDRQRGAEFRNLLNSICQNCQRLNEDQAHIISRKEYFAYESDSEEYVVEFNCKFFRSTSRKYWFRRKF